MVPLIIIFFILFFSEILHIYIFLLNKFHNISGKYFI